MRLIIPFILLFTSNMIAQTFSNENLYQTWEEDPKQEMFGWTLSGFTYLKFTKEGKLLSLDSNGGIVEETDFDPSLRTISINESFNIEVKSLQKNELVLNFIHSNGSSEKKFIPKLKTKSDLPLHEIDKKIKSGIWSGSLVHEIGGKATFEFTKHSSGKIAFVFTAKYVDEEKPTIGELREFDGTIFFEPIDRPVERIQIFEVNENQIIIGLGKREHQLILTEK